MDMKAMKKDRTTAGDVSEQVAKALKQRAAPSGRPADAEHREKLRNPPLDAMRRFAARAAAMRQRLRSSVDSAEVIRADRDRDEVT